MSARLLILDYIKRQRYVHQYTHKTKKQYAADRPKTQSLKDNIQFIDVREAHELPKIEGLNVTAIPLGILENNLHQISTDKKKVLLCQSGKRSLEAATYLMTLGFNHVSSLAGGMNAWRNTINVE